MTIRIPLSAPDITSAEIDAVTAVLHTSRLSLGPELEAFEQAVATYHSMPDAVAVSSGTAGLHLALLTLGVGEGCEVIVPSFAFIAVANAVLQVRATPVFVDIDPVTLNLDPALAEDAITPRTRAILVVHTFGVPAEMDRFQEIARRHNLALLEDACEAIGAEFDSRKAGSFGDLAILGFYPNKQITTGEGGCVLVRDRDLADRLRSLRNQGRATARLNVLQEAERDPVASWFEHAEIGYNYRLSELAAALGRAQLARIDEILAMRRVVAERYQSCLKQFPRWNYLPSRCLGFPSVGSFMSFGCTPTVRARRKILDLEIGCRRRWGSKGLPRDATSPPFTGRVRGETIRVQERRILRSPKGSRRAPWRCHFSTGSQWSSKKR
jgi:perosamine synthetase